MLPLLVFFLLQAPAPADSAGTTPRSPWGNVADLEVVADERASLKGVSRVALSVNVPDSLADQLPIDTLVSTVAFRLEQSGLVVVPKRAIEEPLLSIAVRAIADRGTGTPRIVYRAYADLLQLVRLSDHEGRARLMMASTWHAGSFGLVPAGASADLRARIEEVVDAFLADHAAANGRPAAPAAPR